MEPTAMMAFSTDSTSLDTDTAEYPDTLHLPEGDVPLIEAQAVEATHLTEETVEDVGGSHMPTIKEHAVQPVGRRRSLEEETPLDETSGQPVIAQKAKKKNWYIIHTYSGHENKVKINLERRVESMNMGHKIFSIEVPQKTITKIKDGKRQEKEERLFPGYVLVEMIMDDDSWYVVRHTPGVTKFIGSEKKPVAARESEVKRILMRSTIVKATKKVEIDIKVGDVIRIISGPFSEFEGSVTEVHHDKEKVKASVSIFGRDTPVELHFGQIQKM
jgi:transcriptional antiterminator NusG